LLSAPAAAEPSEDVAKTNPAACAVRTAENAVASSAEHCDTSPELRPALPTGDNRNTPSVDALSSAVGTEPEVSDSTVDAANGCLAEAEEPVSCAGDASSSPLQPALDSVPDISETSVEALGEPADFNHSGCVSLDPDPSTPEEAGFCETSKDVAKPVSCDETPHFHKTAQPSSPAPEPDSSALSFPASATSPNVCSTSSESAHLCNSAPATASEPRKDAVSLPVCEVTRDETTPQETVREYVLVKSEMHSGIKTILPAKKRRHDWFKRGEHQQVKSESLDKRNTPNLHKTHDVCDVECTKPNLSLVSESAELAVDLRQEKLKYSSVELELASYDADVTEDLKNLVNSNASICQKTGTPQPFESPIVSPKSLSPPHPSMTSFDDLSSASEEEDCEPVTEIRIPIDGAGDHKVATVNTQVRFCPMYFFVV